MLVCASCSAELPASAGRCTQCGGVTFTSLDANDGETIAGAPLFARRTDGERRFAAGDLLGGRYRIVGLLGCGGMGEVYRADDLTLGQTVALKFLPRTIDAHAEQLERLRGEVRITRQVSHPNVCRVYDMGSADGRHFLTMEYIDGEDLASLLRRIGRLPEDKALETARQVCAGLAAAHDRGVIHRDLKPANVMLDGRGKVRVTDFGLAVMDESRGAGDRSGTPAYMAPEQLSGGEVSVRTDVYALGLLLYELFTGRRLLDATTIDQLRQLQSNTERLRTSAKDVHLNPSVERVILRCVEFEAAKRPESTLIVAAALPGGDPLAAALAAGETPSPELVAAAGDDASLPPALIIALVALILIGCLSSAIWYSTHSVFRLLQPPYSAEVLGVKARELLQRLRPDDRVVGMAASFDVDYAFTLYVQQRRNGPWTWNDLGAVRPAPITFWQRTSSRLLAPTQFLGGNRITRTDPPQISPGTTLVVTDLWGKLTFLDARPSFDDDRQTPTGQVPWPSLFREAGLDIARFRPAASEWMPPSWGDARAAWTGTAAEYPGIPLRVEAAAYHGRPTYFVMAAPWSSKPRVAPERPPTWQMALAIVVLILVAAPIVAGALMARASINSGRADRRGAARLTTFVAIVQLVATWLIMAHLGNAGEALLLLMAFVWPLIMAAVVWVLYVGLEPYIRRTWPSALITWNRIVDGRFRDARVARDVLLGFGAMAVSDGILDPLIGRLASTPPRGATPSPWLAAASLREALGAVANNVNAAVLVSLVLIFIFALTRMVVRRDWIATTLFALIVAGMLASPYAAVVRNPGGLVFMVAAGMINTVVWVILLLRFGLFAFIAYQLSDLLLSGVVTLSPSAWYSGPSILNLVLITSIAAYAAWVCFSQRRAKVSVTTTSRQRVAAV